MARQRTIRPEAFVDDRLNALPPLVRWAFYALRSNADREGRLVDRPAMLRVLCVPHDDVTTDDFDAMLWELVDAGFIARYTVMPGPLEATQNYIQIVGWDSKRECSIKEAGSAIPPASGGTPREHPTSTKPSRDRGRTRTVPAPSQSSASSPVSVSVSESESVSVSVDSVSPSEKRAARAARKRTKKAEKPPEPHPTWVQEAGHDHEEAYHGIAPYGLIGRALKPLVALHTWLVVRPAWKNYLRETPAEYASPHRFVATFGHWQVEATVRRLPSIASPPKIDPAFLDAVFGKGGRA